MLAGLSVCGVGTIPCEECAGCDVSGFFLHGFYWHQLESCLGFGVVLVVFVSAVAVHVRVAFLFVFLTYILWHTVAIIVVVRAVTVHFVS